MLTEEEAYALLEMCAFSQVPERQIHASLLSRVGAFCREFLDPARVLDSASQEREDFAAAA